MFVVSITYNTDFAEEGSKAENPGPNATVPNAGKSQKSARGRDPLGKEGRNYKRENKQNLLKTLFNKKESVKSDLLNENNIIDTGGL